MNAAGNELVFTDAFIEQLHDQLAGATDRIYIQVMTFDGDAAGLGVAQLLIDAAGRGVEVQLAVDSFAFRYVSDVKVNKQRTPPEIVEEAAATHAMFDRMEAAGVDVTYINPFGAVLQWGPLRNHKKIYVIDDQAYIGGINISDHNFAWLDFNVAVEAPELVSILVEDFQRTRRGERRAVDGPFVTNEFVEATFVELMESAVESIVIASPYALDATLARRLGEVSAPRKVIVAPQRNNFRTFRVSDQYVRERMAAQGVELRTFTQFFHAKFAIFDSRRVFVGSPNFGLHSFRCNQEIGMVIEDAAVVAQFEDMVSQTESVTASTSPFGYALGGFVSSYIKAGTLFFSKVVSPYAPTLTNR